jgi:hypothetical protein
MRAVIYFSRTTSPPGSRQIGPRWEHVFQLSHFSTSASTTSRGRFTAVHQISANILVAGRNVDLAANL